jgi:hypothetical protein
LKEKEVERLARVAQQAGSEGRGQGRANARTSEEVKRLEGRAAALRTQLANLEQQQR